MYEYQLVINGKVKGFLDHSKLEDFLRMLVRDYDYSLKTPISVFVESKEEGFVDQFVGEIRHYVDSLYVPIEHVDKGWE